MCYYIVVSGHNKWSKIKRQKAVTDAKKSNTFSKLSKAISIAAKHGGADPEANINLRSIIEKAKKERMPKENIQRAIEKGAGMSGSSAYEEAVYEGYGPNGIAFLLKAITDNKNRTVADVRTIFNKFGGSLGTSGSTAYIFSPDPENPAFEIEVTDLVTAQKLSQMYENLEDNEDIQEVYTNFTVSDELANLL